MRFHNNNAYVLDGELSARMNPGGDDGLFGVIGLGVSDLCLDTAEDARRLLEAAARIVAWYEFDGHPHEYAPLTTSTHCTVCGLLEKNGNHAAPVITDADTWTTAGLTVAAKAVAS